MSSASRRRWAVLLLMVLFVLVIGLSALVLVTASNELTPALSTKTALAQTTANSVTELPAAAVTLAIPSATAPYEPTLYAQRQLERQQIDPSADATSRGAFMNFMATETALVATYQGSHTPAATLSPMTPSPSKTPLDYIACAWQWANSDLPDVAARTQNALMAAGLEQVTVNHVAGFGENCIAQNGEINRFAVKDADFSLTIAVPDVADKAALGGLVSAIYEVFQSDLRASLPPNLNRLELRFQANDAEVVIGINFAALQAAIAQGLTGAELWAALEG